MTKAELLADLEYRIGQGNDVDATGLTYWLNDAYLHMVDEVQKANPDYFAKSSTADLDTDVQEYDLPDDFVRALMVTVDYDSTPMRAAPIPTINSIPVLGRTDTNQGFTTAAPGYYLIGNSIGLLPIPSAPVDEGLRLWYAYTPEELSADGDEPALPRQFHSLIVLGAYATFLDRDDEHAAAEQIRRRFDKRVADMVESLNDRQADEPKSVQITDGQGIYYDESDLI